jgi:hypothetical protein
MPGGRKSKLTPETQDAICQAVEKGAPVTIAAAAVGIADRTVNFWLQRGANAELAEDGKDEKYRLFLLAVQQSRARYCARAVECIHDAMPKDWRAALAMLERQFPAFFSKVLRGEVSVTQDKADISQDRAELKLLVGGAGEQDAS